MKRMFCAVNVLGLLAAASVASAAITEPVKTDAGLVVGRGRYER